MNRKTTKNKVRSWKLGITFYALVILFASSSLIINILSTKAAPSSSFVSADVTPTSTDTPTDTPTPAPTSASTPTPTPTDTPTPTPTSASTTGFTPRHRPTPTPEPTDTPVDTPTPTNTPTPTAQPTTPAVIPPTPTNGVSTTPTATNTATATAVVTLLTGPDDHSANKAINTLPINPSSGGKTGGPDILTLSLDIGTPILLIFGGSLFWLYSRRNQQVVPALQKWHKSDSTPNTPTWTSSTNRATNNALAQASNTFAAVMPSTTTLPYATAHSPSSNEPITPGANTLALPVLPPLGELTHYMEAKPQAGKMALPALPPLGVQALPLYGSSDLRPITMDLPKLTTNQHASVPTPYPTTGDLPPLPLDVLSMSQNLTRSTAPEQMLDEPVLAAMPENLTSTENSSTATPLSTTAKTRAVQPPDITVDSLLETAMQQAQIGLFVVPGKKRDESKRNESENFLL